MHYVLEIARGKANTLVMLKECLESGWSMELRIFFEYEERYRQMSL